ncbi:ABC transporter permease [Candidatus Sumerlaeota bacterium]|nr:ABC transporter permease [Candidatus Sumerlaeota bacterium]
MRWLHRQSNILPLGATLRFAWRGMLGRKRRTAVVWLGVGLGAACLMAFLASHQLRLAAAQERDADQQARRMAAALERELGALDGRRIAVAGIDAPDGAELRLLALLSDDGAAIQPYETDSPEAESPNVILIFAHAAGLFTQASPSSIPLYSTNAQINNAVILPRFPDAAQREREERREIRERRREAWTAALALLVAAIAACNALLLSVTERIREFGTMLCLGALPVLIRRMVLLEALLIGATAGLAGAMAGGIFSGVLAAWQYGAPLLALWSPALAVNLALTCAASTLCSLIAAVYPAIAASRMLPADALRAEI